MGYGRNMRRGQRRVGGMDRFYGRLTVGPGARSYASVEAAVAAASQLPGSLKPGIVSFQGVTVYLCWCLTAGIGAAQWAETARLFEQAAERYGVYLAGPITATVPFDFDAVAAGGHRLGAAPDCMCLAITVGTGGHRTEREAVQMMQAFARDQVEPIGLKHVQIISDGGKVFGLWQFSARASDSMWREAAAVLKKLADSYGLHASGPVTREASVDLDALVSVTPEMFEEPRT